MDTLAECRFTVAAYVRSLQFKKKAELVRDKKYGRRWHFNPLIDDNFQQFTLTDAKLLSFSVERSVFCP